MAQQSWRTWLRASQRDPNSPARTPNPLGALTGQDARVSSDISACPEVYSGADHAGQKVALAAIWQLLPSLQPQCRPFARELIAFSLDWSDRARLWPLVETT